MKYWLFFICMLPFFGCTTIPEPDPNKKTEISGVVDYEGNFESKIVPGVTNIKYLNNLDDSVTFEAGKPFNLIISGFDPQFYDLQYNFDGGSKIGKIKVIKREAIATVYLKNKCEKINIPPGAVPNIIVEDNTPDHQVIVTPRYSKKCEFLGFEIRYGSTQQGCSDSGYIKALRNCSDRKDTPVSKDWSKILFGD